MNINLNKINKIHFIGIGGIGISAVAGIAHLKHFLVEGSDVSESEIIQGLRDHKITVHISQNAENINEKIDLVVHSVAVPPNNPELVRAKELNIPILTYPQFLGALLENRYGIGVSGTDGKTTTTAMVAKIFIEAGLDPTVVLGSQAQYLEGNWRGGDDKYFIFESDEYRRAFHNYFPEVAVITNIREDHLDCYKDLEDIRTAFKRYLSQVGTLIIYNMDDQNTVEVVSDSKIEKISYAIDNKADLMARDIVISDGFQSFKIIFENKELGEIKLSRPARYNVYNALGAIAVALKMGVGFEDIKKSLESFHGIWRRFEKLGEIKDVEVITDYAHTPSAVRQTIEAAKEFYPGKKILSVFQPHQYNRTKNFFDEFTKSFELADKAIISDIFYVEGRENPDDFDVSSKKLAEASIGDVGYGGDLAQTEKMIRNYIDDYSTQGGPASGWDVLLIMGAGNIYNMAKKLINN